MYCTCFCNYSIYVCIILYVDIYLAKRTCIIIHTWPINKLNVADDLVKVGELVK